MWTEEQRARHFPRGRRYPSDSTDEEWALIAPFIPPPRSGGRGRKTDMREVMNAILYLLATGCQWRALPKDFPPRSTVYAYFWDWRRSGAPGRLTVEIVKRNDGQKGFAVLPRRWVVERTLAWLTRCRRLARHYEALAAVAFIKLAMIRIMLRRLANPSITA